VVVPGGGGAFTASERDVTVHTLSNPWILASGGEEQHIFSGDSVPTLVSSGSAGQTSQVGSTSTITPGGVGSDFVINQQIQRTDVGVDFTVTPTSISEEVSSLDVRIEVKSLKGSAQSSSTDLGPTITQFKLEAKVKIADGSVVMVGSAPKDSGAEIVAGVPWLGRIPILGWAFKATSRPEQRHRIVAALQVTQIRSPSEERSESLERALAFERHNQRMEPLRARTSLPYALLVATRGSQAEAERLLPDLGGLAGSAQVVPWEQDASPRFDVYLTGFEELSQLGALSVELRKRGFTPRLEVLTELSPR